MNRQRNKSSFFNQKYFTLLIVCVVAGVIIGLSYNSSKEKKASGSITNYYYLQQSSYQEDLINQQERNKALQEELDALEKKIRDYEKLYASKEQQSVGLIEQADKLRLALGLIESEGEGIRVMLQDGDYDAESTNPNNYIVHESHIFSVINELKISGAEAISINGQRLKSNSYISCNGPVITIDGKQYPAPFIIEAVGDQNVLSSALEISGGILDQLLNDQIIVTIEEVDNLTMPSVNVES